MNGYDMYDCGARGYYPAGDFIPTIDPLAEKYYSISPYAWCGNNPVNRIDPDGRQDVVTAPYRLYETYRIVRALQLATIATGGGVIILGAYMNKQQVANRAEEVRNSLISRAGINTGESSQNARSNPELKEQEKREGNAKRELDQNQADMATAIKQNTPDPRPDGGSDPKRPLSEWKPITVVVTGIVIAKNIYDNITKPEPVPTPPAPAPAPAPTPAPAPMPTPTPIQPKQPWVLY